MLSLTAAAFLVIIAPLSTSADDDNATPPVQISGRVAYMTGGVSAEEREAMFAAAKDYTLKLVFAARQQADVRADVTVSIAADDGKPMMKATDTGPYLFARLPPGDYKISVSSHEETLETSVSVRASEQANAAFYW
jgi:hypothetical protein